MTEVVMYLKETNQELPLGFNRVANNQVAVDIDWLLVTRASELPLTNQVHVYKLHTNWPITEGYYKWGGTRVTVNEVGEITAQGKSLRNFVNTIGRIRNGKLGNHNRVLWI